MKRYEHTLPPQYRAVYRIDAADKKVGLLLNLVGALLMIGIIALAAVCIRPWRNGTEEFLVSPWRPLLLALILLAYIVLHELTHGAVYKLMTGQKLKFGFTATVAFCGVPQIYVYRTTALCALLAPFLVFNLVFGLPALLLENAWDRMLAAMAFAIHFGGCVGDLYDTILYLFRFRDPRTLMRDTGPEQTFYLPQDAADK